mmetsp:Transcript_12419/g.14703  ORF Transcript_12419/g.14703 Transcript_12419/m.14703 type:complete len:274 (-) Transcript_12419:182-1003(-)
MRRTISWLSSLFFLKDNQASCFRTVLDQWKRERAAISQNYHFLLMCIIFQWVHNLATNLARFLHVPQTPLYDLGFVLVPKIDTDYEFLCDVVFSICILIAIAVWLSPFFNSRPSMTSTGILSRFMAVLVLAQSLRILTFVMTDLPGPSPRCKPEHKLFNQPQTLRGILWRSWSGMFSHGCGELVFSSRVLLVVLCLLTVSRYGRRRRLTISFAVLAVTYSFLMISARREYSLSIFIAWYVVPLLWIAYGRSFPENLLEVLPTRQPKEEQGRRD